MNFENAIVPIGPHTKSNSATVSTYAIEYISAKITKNVAIITAIRPSPISTFEVSFLNANFNAENAPNTNEIMVKYNTYSFIKPPKLRW